MAREQRGSSKAEGDDRSEWAKVTNHGVIELVKASGRIPWAVRPRHRYLHVYSTEHAPRAIVEIELPAWTRDNA